MTIKGRILQQKIWNEEMQQWERGYSQTLAEIVETRDGSNVQDVLDKIPDQIAVAQSQAKETAVEEIRAGVTETGDTLAKQYTLITALQDLVRSEDIDLQTVQEIVEFIRENRDNLELMGANKVRLDAVVNDLTTIATVEGKVLDARQGKILKGFIDALREDITALQNKAQDFVTETQLSDKLNTFDRASRPIVSEAPPLNPVDGQIWHQPVGTIAI